MRTRLHRNQQGMSSLLVTMLMMVITSLIVLAFAQIARREQRTALDNQLSSQAYYAAESGINDAKELIASGASLTGYDQCSNGLTNSSNADLSKDGDGTVKYTCLKINPTPKTLIGRANTSQPTVFHVKSSETSAPYFSSGITISWDKGSGTQSPYNCQTSFTYGDSFTPAAEWNCPFSVLQYDITATPSGVFNTSSLDDSTETVFVIPSAPGNYGSAYPFIPGDGQPFTVPNGRGNRAPATSCTETRCSVTISNLNQRDYYLSLRYIYGTESNVTISRADGGGFADSQAIVDVTGRAQDVLRRVVVAVNMAGDSSGVATAMLVGDGPCKWQFIGGDGAGNLTYKDACSSDATEVIADINEVPEAPPADPVPPAPPVVPPVTSANLSCSIKNIIRQAQGGGARVRFEFIVANNGGTGAANLNISGTIKNQGTQAQYGTFNESMTTVPANDGRSTLIVSNTNILAPSVPVRVSAEVTATGGVAPATCTATATI